jgi:CO/xanthine dehydrogenase FAD-binding subunit
VFAGKWDTPDDPDDDVLRRFGSLVAEAASPIDDVRGTADYRRHALSVLGRRLLGWAWADLKGAQA